jgi:hypothetical protein
MKRRLIIIILCAVILPLSAHAGFSPEVQADLEKRGMDGQQMIFARDYPKATEIFGKLIEEYPDHPIGYFGKMAVLEMKMLEHDDFHLGKELEETAKLGQKAMLRTLNRKPTDWDLLVCGSLLGLEGFYWARQAKWWDAYSLGVKSRQTFKRIKKRNPEFYDADFGLGMYLYWRSVFTKTISFLSIFPDRRAEGIAIVQQVVEKGKFARDLAEVNLGMMWMEERKYEESHRIFGKYAERYPNNVLLHMYDGRSLIGARRYDEAVGQFRHMLKLAPELKKGHYFIGMARVLQSNPKYYAEAESELEVYLKDAPGGEWKGATYYWLGRLEERRGNKAKAKAYYEDALKENPNLKNLKLRIRGIGSGL